MGTNAKYYANDAIDKVLDFTLLHFCWYHNIIIFIYLFFPFFLYRNEQRKLQEKLKSVESKLIVGGVNLVGISKLITKKISHIDIKDKFITRKFVLTSNTFEKKEFHITQTLDK